MSQQTLRAAAGVDAKRLHQLLVICAIGWGVFGCNYFVLGRMRGVYIDIGIIVCTLLIRAWMMRQVASRALVAAHLGVLVNVLGLVAAAFNSGQGHSTALWFLVCVPLLTAHMLGTRAATVWAFISILTAVLVAASEQVIHVEPEFIASGHELIFDSASLTCIVLAFAIAARRAHDKQVATIELQAATLAQQTVALAAARDAALESARLKSDFVATVSHEIRTPLSGVLGSVSLLEDSGLNPVQAELTETLRQSGAQLLHVVNDILDFSKIEANKLEIVRQSVALQTTIGQVVSQLMPLARDRSLSLTVELAHDAPAAIVTDAVRLTQILANLVGNALKFTSRGSVRIEVSKKDDQLVFAIVDTGVGIAAEDATKLFQPFSQVENKRSGTGLGLVITRRLVELLGGKIWFTSERGVGTTFFVSLPLVVAPMQALKTTGEPTRARFDATLGASHPLAILLVEDQAINRTLGLRLLQRFGYQAEVVNDGEAAVAACAARHYDLVLMDIRLPGIDGAEATRRIRKQHEGGAQPRIVAMTANVIEDQQWLQDMGFDGYLGKPIDTEVLRATLTGTPAMVISSASQ